MLFAFPGTFLRQTQVGPQQFSVSTFGFFIPIAFFQSVCLQDSESLPVPNGSPQFVPFAWTSNSHLGSKFNLIAQIKLRPNFSPPFSDKFHCSVIPEVILNPTTLADSPAKSEEIKQPICVLDLQVLPGPEVESFAVEGKMIIIDRIKSFFSAN